MDDLIESVYEYAKSVFRCDLYSVHGIQHWCDVDDSAQLICKETEADLTVVRFFAYLHDSCRFDDGGDLGHGPRAADSLVSLPVELAVLDPEQMSVLDYAIRHHTDGDVSDDPTIGACWDSDRLDLGRVGKIPSAVMMSTKPGRDIARFGNRG